MRAFIYVVLTILFIPLTTFSFAFDVDSDGKEGLAESIHALQVSAGIIPSTPATGDAVPADVLKGKIFSNSDR